MNIDLYFNPDKLHMHNRTIVHASASASVQHSLSHEWHIQCGPDFVVNHYTLLEPTKLGFSLHTVQS